MNKKIYKHGVLEKIQIRYGLKESTDHNIYIHVKISSNIFGVTIIFLYSVVVEYDLNKLKMN